MDLEQVLKNPLLLDRLKLYGLSKLHEQGFTGKGIKVGVIDRFDIEHGYNVVSCINDELCGTAPGVTIVKYKLPKDFYYKDIVQALKECIVDEVDIVNMSIGSATDSLTLHRQIQECKRHNIMMVCAAGNEGRQYNDRTDIKLYPEEYEETISVGSVDSDLQWSAFESHGSSIDFVGVGSNTVVKMKDGSYQLATGTSFSTPHITGIFSCLMSMFRSQGINPKVDDLKNYAIEHTIDFGLKGKDNFYGNGLPCFDISEFIPIYHQLNGLTKGKISERMQRIKDGEPEEEVNKDYNIIDYEEIHTTTGEVIEVPVFSLNK